MFALWEYDLVGTYLSNQIMIYVTGDVHGEIDINKLATKNFDPSNMTKEDFVIVAGDFGLVWDDSHEELFWRKWLDKKPWTTLFVDGNHENHTKLDVMPVEKWNGGKIHRINDSIFHLMRGQIFTIEGKTIFTFGGADSIDKGSRREHISWWKRELPSVAECKEGLVNLRKHKNQVDYIVTHTCPSDMLERIYLYKNITPAEKYLDRIQELANFKQWFFGHHHTDMNVGDKYRALYHDIVRL